METWYYEVMNIEDCVTFARVLNNEGVIFTGMDNRDKASLRHQILDSVLWIDSPIQEDLSSTIDNEPEIPLEVAEKLMNEVTKAKADGDTSDK